jgi:hypothetical protein
MVSLFCVSRFFFWRTGFTADLIVASIESVEKETENDGRA